jgi:hypothetical protein
MRGSVWVLFNWVLLVGGCRSNNSIMPGLFLSVLVVAANLLVLSLVSNFAFGQLMDKALEVRCETFGAACETFGTACETLGAAFETCGTACEMFNIVCETLDIMYKTFGTACETV